MRIKYIDVLKAIAIISVVLYHLGVLDFGYLGVDIFLVIAGYFTTKSLERNIFKSNSRGGFNVYCSYEISRIIRLLPLLLVVCALCMGVGYFAMLPDDYENLSQSVIATNLFCNNILAAITTKNYWDVVNEYKPLMHTWYVGILMQFYLVYPFIYFIAKLNRFNPRRVLLVLLLLFATLSLLFFFFTSNAAVRFYYLPARFFEFAAGGIIALIIVPGKSSKVGRWFVFLCYLLLLFLLIVNLEFIPSKIKLVVVVALSCSLLTSQNVLEENSLTSNKYLAALGAASYSVFVWHQVLLAFCRYIWTSHFTFSSYLLLFLVTCFLSWLSYQYIEQFVNKTLRSGGGEMRLYGLVLLVFLFLNAYAGYIYLNAGVVRDIPELYISKSDIHRGMHKTYNDKIYNLDRPFETNKRHWLVLGNSYGRDFSNVILESEIADSIELSYIYIDKFDLPQYGERFATADRVFLSSRGTDESLVAKVDSVCQVNNFSIDRLVIVGTKSFGESNGQFYVRRFLPNYFEQRTMMEGDWVMESNEKMKAFCGERYLDLIGLVIDEKGTMPVFTPDHHFISQDCRHFSMGGAKYFATLIDWSKYLD